MAEIDTIEFRTRHDWQTASQPVVGPAPRADVTLAVCHYTANPSGVNGSSVDFLRATQNDYLNSRGYSLGYWYFVDREGVAWQIRGPHPSSDHPGYNAAANPGDKQDAGNANNWTAPILFPHGIDEPIPQVCIDTAKVIWRWLGLRNRPIPHSDIDYTGCCGDAARAQINGGLLDLDDVPAPVPPPIIGDDMDIADVCYLWTHPSKPGTWLVGPGGATYMTAASAEFYRAQGVEKYKDADDTARNAYIAQSGVDLT